MKNAKIACTGTEPALLALAYRYATHYATDTPDDDYSENVVNPVPSNINNVTWYMLSYNVIGQHKLAQCCPELLLL